MKPGARTPWYLCVLLTVLLALASASPLHAQNPYGQAITIVGTVLDSNGAPPPSNSSITLVEPTAAGAGIPARSCASGSPDAGGSFELTLLPLAAGCTAPGMELELLVNNIPAQPLLAVPAVAGTYAFNFTLGVPLGQPPAPVVANPTGLTKPLAVGCSQIVVSLGTGTSGPTGTSTSPTPAQVAARLANPAALVAIWHYDNQQQRFTAYFTDPSAPSDFVSLAPVDAVFICVSQPTSITSP